MSFLPHILFMSYLFHSSLLACFSQLSVIRTSAGLVIWLIVIKISSEALGRIGPGYQWIYGPVAATCTSTQGAILFSSQAIIIPIHFLSLSRDITICSSDSHHWFSTLVVVTLRLKIQVVLCDRSEHAVDCFDLSTRVWGWPACTVQYRHNAEVHLSLVQWSFLASCKHEGEDIASGWVTSLSVFISHILLLLNQTPTVAKHCISHLSYTARVGCLYFYIFCMYGCNH